MEENVSILTVQEILSLIDSPNPEVSNDVRHTIKIQLSNINQKWIIYGLVDYFLISNSKKLLELILRAPEHHWKHLLDKISEGLKGQEKYRFITILLYAVTKNPPYPWVKKIPEYGVIKDLFACIDPYSEKEKDVSVIVSSLMVLVALLPTVPNHMSGYLRKMCDLFFSLLKYVPPKDSGVNAYLKLSVCSFFQRLYALYPCYFMNYLKLHKEAMAPNSNLYEKTLYPMFEKVRLHPLILRDKDTDMLAERWKGKDRHELIQECAQLSLDPFYDVPEYVSFSSTFKVKEQTSTSLPGKSFNTPFEIWSPGFNSSAASSIKSTPVYSQRSLMSSLPQTPLETAIEATPETTPYICPSPLIKIEKPSQGVLTQHNDIALLNAKLKDIVLERKNDKTKEGKSEMDFFCVEENEPEDGKASSEIKQEDFADTRQRKLSVFNIEQPEDLERKLSIDPILEEDYQAESSRRDSCSTPVSGDESIGVVSHTSWSEVVQSMRTKRLRFLSQCGPPPNIGAFKSKPTEPQPIPKLRRRSRSVPNLADEVCGSVSSIRRFTPLSPDSIEKVESSTQTEEVVVVDPYEQLIKSMQEVPECVKPNRFFCQDDSTAWEFLQDTVDNMSGKAHSIDIDWSWVNLCGRNENKYRQQLRGLYTLLKMEKFKKEIYAERNRRLFSKIKHLQFQIEKDKSNLIEKEVSPEGAKFHEIQKVHQKFHELSESSKAKLGEAQAFAETVGKENKSLKVKCEELVQETQQLNKEIQKLNKSVSDSQRANQLHQQHSTENEILKQHVQSLQKQILILGELQNEFSAQIKLFKDPDHYVTREFLDADRERLNDELSKIEEERRKHSQQSTFYTQMIYILEDKISDQEKSMSDLSKQKKDYAKEINELKMENIRLAESLQQHEAIPLSNGVCRGSPGTSINLEFGAYARNQLANQGIWSPGIDNDN